MVLANTSLEKLKEVFLTSLSQKRIYTVNGPLTVDDVYKLIDKIKSFDVTRREAIGMCIENGKECLSTYIALALLDIVAVPLPPTIPEMARDRLWKKLGCRYVIVENNIKELVSHGPPPIWPDDIYWVMHSSGSTGIPKAIPITLSSVERNAWDVMNTLNMGNGLTHLGSMSQCYTSGLYNSFLLPIITGGKVLVGTVATALKIKEFLEVIRQGEPDIIWVNPVVLTLMRRRSFDANVFAKVKVLISCTAPLRHQDCVDFERFFKSPVLQSYGLTETLIVSLELPTRDPLKGFSAGVIIGNKSAVKIDRNGTLTISNGAVTPGYASMENSRIKLNLPNGEPDKCFSSGDLVNIDSENRLTIKGRLTNVINVEGVKISLEELESVLLSYEGIEAAAVAGIPDEYGNERPVALIKAKGEGAVDTFALMNICADKLGTKARPVSIHVVPHIPLTNSGKIDRKALSDLLSNLYIKKR